MTIVFFSQVLCLNSSEPPPTLPGSAGLGCRPALRTRYDLGLPPDGLQSPQSAGLPCRPRHPESQAGPQSGIVWLLIQSTANIKAERRRGRNDPGQAAKAPRDTRLLSFQRPQREKGIPDFVKKPRTQVPRGHVGPVTLAVTLPVTLHSVPSSQPLQAAAALLLTSGPGSAPTRLSRHCNALWAAVSDGRRSPDRKRLGRHCDRTAQVRQKPNRRRKWRVSASGSL